MGFQAELVLVEFQAELVLVGSLAELVLVGFPVESALVVLLALYLVVLQVSYGG